MAADTSRTLSFVIPAQNEEASIRTLADRIIEVVRDLDPGWRAQLIFVDDGSTDDTWARMSELAAETPQRVEAVRLRRNFGKAVALEAGFRHVEGDVVFTMDADLQDDPAEIHRFLEKLDEGFDLVSGWKKVRHDPLSKTLPSRLFNKVTALATGVRLHDFNCGFKCYRRAVIDNVRVYGELHRYIPVLANDYGFRIGEIAVQHHERKHGQSKYGPARYLRGLVDLITVLATTRWLTKPGHLFGGIGIVLGLIGFLALAYLAGLWTFAGQSIGDRPLLMFGVMVSILSVQLISLGVIAELLIKNTKMTDVDLLVRESVGRHTTPDEHNREGTA